MPRLQQIASLLRRVAAMLERGDTFARLVDCDGTTIGHFDATTKTTFRLSLSTDGPGFEENTDAT